MREELGLRVTVCELANDHAQLEAQWEALAEHVQSQQSDLVLLPEMPFYRWLATSPTVVQDEWARSVAAHDRWMDRLDELGAATVLGTRPVQDDRERFNVGFAWTARDGELSIHKKHYLPDEEGFWEASWYSRGDGDFTPRSVHQITIGFAICTEMWFLQHAREYAKQRVQVLACPRATPAGTVEKWIVGGRVAAVVSGAYCLSSNFSGHAGQLGRWAGTGWIIEPEEGRVLGTTSSDRPFLTLDIDLSVADAAKRTYPRYVLD